MILEKKGGGREKIYRTDIEQTSGHEQKQETDDKKNPPLLIRHPTDGNGMVSKKDIRKVTSKKEKGNPCRAKRKKKGKTKIRYARKSWEKAIKHFSRKMNKFPI